MLGRLAAMLLSAGSAAAQTAVAPGVGDYARAEIALWREADAVLTGRLDAVRAGRTDIATILEIRTVQTLSGERRKRWTVVLRGRLDGDAALAETPDALSKRVGEELVVAVAAAPEQRLQDCALDGGDCGDAPVAAMARVAAPVAEPAPGGGYLPEVASSRICRSDLSTFGLGCSGGAGDACAALEDRIVRRVWCARPGLLRFLSEPGAGALLSALRTSE